MIFGSLFTGIGGIDLGFERAGMKCAWQVEIDDYCTRVLEKHWPNVERFRDVREVGKHNLSPVDLIAGGFPCQPVSVSGLQKGDQDERWLWPEYFRIVCEIQPRWIVVENVPGLYSARNGELFTGILRDLSSLRYDAEWLSIYAASFGAPHLRERIFILAYPQGKRWKRILCPDIDRQYEAQRHGWEVTLDAQGNPFLWFEKSVGEPAILGMDDGLPNRVDQFKTPGNAVVPQVAEFIGRSIMEAERIGE